MSRADDLATFGRKIAAAQGIVDNRPRADWLAYGQACQDALSRGRQVPALLPTSPPAQPPARPPALIATPGPWGPPPPPSPQRPVLCAACSGPVEARAMPRRSFLPRLFWGLTWRYSILGAIFLVAQSQAQKPWLLIAGVVLGGLVLGLWRRRSLLARLWRTAVVAAGAVYVAPLFSVYPDVLVGSIGALTAGPLLASWRRDS